MWRGEEGAVDVYGGIPWHLRETSRKRAGAKELRELDEDWALRDACSTPHGTNFKAQWVGDRVGQEGQDRAKGKTFIWSTVASLGMPPRNSFVGSTDDCSAPSFIAPQVKQLILTGSGCCAGWFVSAIGGRGAIWIGGGRADTPSPSLVREMTGALRC